LKYLSIIKINQTQKDQEAAQSAASWSFNKKIILTGVDRCGKVRYAINPNCLSN
jgi:hypothetical protein